MENHKHKVSTVKYTLEQIIHPIDYKDRKTAIVCTIGPACNNVDILEQMLERGMTVARLNFSHGDHDYHGMTVKNIREACSRNDRYHCAIMLDTKGPEIRTGMLTEHKSINLKKGQVLEITTDYSFIGNSDKISCSYKGLMKSVKVGSNILIADGSLSCKVLEIYEESILTEVLNQVSIGERKNMNLPGCQVDIATVTDKDEYDIKEFGLKYNIDLIALSFARSANDIKYVRDIMGPRGSKIKIIAKIENQDGLNNYDEILETSDGIMVARGDLGMEIPPQKVFLAQKWMIKKANEVGKPIITATQMMESIISNPRPTRAEASDVANAVLDGSDAVMLSGETANGKYPVIAVETMAKICTEAELVFDNVQYYWSSLKQDQEVEDVEAMCASAVQLSFEIQAKLIICFTSSGKTARLISKYRPIAQVIAVGNDEKAILGLCMSRGVKCFKVENFIDKDKILDLTLEYAQQQGMVKRQDKVVLVKGLQVDGLRNVRGIKVLTVGQ